MSEQRAKRVLVVILALYLALGLAYSVINPIFESPDEALNYANIRFLIEERRLPVLEPDEATKAHHPPLYYAMGALLTYRTPNENFDTITEQVNPFWIHRVGESDVDNKSLYLHDPELERFPYRDVALGVHLVRWLSLLLGAGTVLLVYATTRVLQPRRAWLAPTAAALVAFNPMFLFISASVHDDALANLIAAALLFITAKLLMQGATTRRAVILGVITGLSILTKLTCLLALPTLGLALLWRSLSEQARSPAPTKQRGGVHVGAIPPWSPVQNGSSGWGKAFRLGFIVAALALLIGGWWLVRNQLLYGDPTSMGRQVEAWGGTRENAPDILAALRELGFLHDSAWGVFGYGQIPLPRWLYKLTRLLSILAAGGIALFYARRRNRVSKHPGSNEARLSPPVLLILLSAPLVTLAANFARMTLIDTADFGRYMFVSLAFLAPLYAIGLGEWLPNGKQLLAGTGVSMLALAIFALLSVLQPAYAKPRMLSKEEIAARTKPIDLRFGPTQSIHLLGYDLNRNRAHPGEDIEVTLCWEALAPMEENYVYFVHFLGPEESIVGARNTHPGLSRYPTGRWERGDLFCDTVDTPVEEWAPAPAVYAVEIGWHEEDTAEDNEENERLPAYTPDGDPLELTILEYIKVEPEKYPTEDSFEIPHRVDANLGDQITLLGYELSASGEEINTSRTLTATLYWKAHAPAPVDYTVFVHLAAAEGPPHAQDDCQPQRGSYPTSFWNVGEVVTDTHMLHIPADLPAGEYPLVVGMYLLETGERLPALDGTGNRLPDDVVPLTEVNLP